MGVTPPDLDTTLPPTPIPSHIDVADTDPDVLGFIMMYHRQDVENIMAQAHARYVRMLGMQGFLVFVLVCVIENSGLEHFIQTCKLMMTCSIFVA